MVQTESYLDAATKWSITSFRLALINTRPLPLPPSSTPTTATVYNDAERSSRNISGSTTSSGIGAIFFRMQ